MRKHFDRTLYQENDEIARNHVKRLFANSEYEIVDNPKKMGVDLLVMKDGVHVFNIECEIKRVWRGSNFPYDNVQFPERKEKYAVLDKPTYFFMFNDNQSNYVVVKDRDLLASPKVEVPNKYLYKGEKFFQVPLIKAKFDTIKGIS